MMQFDVSTGHVILALNRIEDWLGLFVCGTYTDRIMTRTTLVI
jgi:hypothetical protein